jgi:hypothetical protein
MCQCANDLFAPPRRSKAFSVFCRNRSGLTRFYYLDFGNQCANACADFYVGMLMCQCANDLFRKAKKFKVDGRKRSGLTRFWDVAIGYSLKIDFRFVCSAAAEQTNLQIDLLLFFSAAADQKK